MTAIHDPRSLLVLLLGAALVAAVLTGGVPGFLIGFTAALVAVDRLLDLGGSTVTGAEQAFARLSRARRRRQLAARVRRRPLAGLAYLADDAGWAAVAARRRLGTQTIDVASIVGPCDRQKATAFDDEFRPPSWSRGRWTQMYLAAQRGTALPPVSVYRVGDRHFVRDGHHRVSIARAVGAMGIEAQVVELR